MLHSEEHPLINAVKSNNVDAVRSLIEAKENTEVFDEQEKTPLMLAAEKGYEEITRILIEAKADTEADHDDNAYTPLCYAIENNHEAVTKILLGTKTMIEINETLLIAAAFGRDKMVRVLLDAKANIETHCTKKRTPLANAIRFNREETTRVLLDAKANVKTEDIYKYTPLHHAASRNSQEIISMLLDRKADPFAQNNQKKIALQLVPSHMKAILNPSSGKLEYSDIRALLKTAMRHPRIYAFCAGLHPRCGATSFLYKLSERSSLFDRQVLRPMFTLSGNSSPSPAKKFDKSKKRERSPSPG